MHASLLRQYEQYQQRVNQLFKELSAYPETTLARRPADGGWSALQTMYHLMLAESLTLAYLRKKLGYDGTYEKAGWAADWRSLKLLFFLRFPLKWPAPKAVSEEHFPDNITFAGMQKDWAELHRKWNEFIRNLPEPLLDKAIYRHPRAGMLSWKGTFSFFSEHLRRHTKQIRRAIS